MPAVNPADLGEGAEVDFYVRRCGTCHETPDPAAHTAAEWEGVVGRMRANMAVMSVEPLTDEESGRIVGFLQERASSDE